MEKTAEDLLLEKIDNKIKEANKDGVTKSELKAISDSVEEIKKSDLSEKIKTEVERLSGELNALKENPKEVAKGHATIKEALLAAFTEPTVKAEIDAIVDSGGKQKAPLKVTLKAVGTISVASTIGAGSTQVTITEDTGIISTIRKRELTYLANVSVGRIDSNRALWIEETDEEGTPIFIAEGASKTQLDVQYIEQTQPVKKIAVYGKVTTELMADIPQLINYIQNNLMRRMDIVIESDLFNGTGVGDNIKGLYAFDTAFTGGSLAGTISSANELDVIEAIALQVKTAFGQPGALFIHPSTMSKLKLIKDNTGRPVWKDYITISGEMVVSGLKIVETTAVTADNFIGGDTKVVNVLVREDLSMQIGLDGNDFTQNKKTMLIEKRLVQFVSANDVPLIISGDFTSAKALLQAP